MCLCKNRQLHIVRVCAKQAAEQKSLDQVAGFQKSLEAFSEGILLVDTSTPDWDVLFQNEAWLGITGMSREEVLGSKLWHLFTPAGQTKVHPTAPCGPGCTSPCPPQLHLQLMTPLWCSPHATLFTTAGQTKLLDHAAAQ